MEIEIKEDDQLPDFDRQSIERLSAEAFPPNEMHWTSGDIHVLVREGREVVSQVEILVREVLVGGQPVRLGGIGGVATFKAWQKKGLAEAAMRMAQAYLKDPLQVDFGMLVCGDIMVHYYSKLGWVLLPIRDMWIMQPQGRILYHDTNIMILPVCKSVWPQGEIDLCGLPW